MLFVGVFKNCFWYHKEVLQIAQSGTNIWLSSAHPSLSQQTWSGFSLTTVSDKNRQSGLSPTTVPKLSKGICYKWSHISETHKRNLISLQFMVCFFDTDREHFWQHFETCMLTLHANASPSPFLKIGGWICSPVNAVIWFSKSIIGRIFLVIFHGISGEIFRGCSVLDFPYSFL